ncbi:unnamed protein product, partial [Larinioides sclopetarius]
KSCQRTVSSKKNTKLLSSILLIGTNSAYLDCSEDLSEAKPKNSQ